MAGWVFLRAFLVLYLVTSLSGAVQAQEWYINVEKVPSMAMDGDRAQHYTKLVSGVEIVLHHKKGPRIVIGPFLSRRLAYQNMRRLKAAGIIPRRARLIKLNVQDMATQQGEQDAQNFSLEGDLLAPGEELEDVSLLSLDEQIKRQQKPPESIELRKRIQVSLKWMGHYKGPIDGDFGPATQRSIRAFQATTYTPRTGILSEEDIDALLLRFEGETARLGFERFQSIEAGIALQMPMRQLDFKKTTPPFLEFSSTAEATRVLLFSQSGDRQTLRAYFHILKKLDFAQEEVEHRSNWNDFILIAKGAGGGSYSYAVLEGDKIKGFSLIYAQKDSALMRRAGELMRESFQTLDSMSLSLEITEDIEILDLLSDSVSPPPVLVQSGFYFSKDGAILTDRRIWRSCQRILLDGYIEAEFDRMLLGGAVLRAKKGLVPRNWAHFSGERLWPDEKLFIAGYSLGGSLGAPSLTRGRVLAVSEKTASKELTSTVQNYIQLKIKALPGDIGGPAFNAFGEVVGFLSAHQEDSERILPLNVGLVRLLPKDTSQPKNNRANMEKFSPQDLAALAKEITVSVACWR